MARAWFADVVTDPNGRPIASATVDVFITGTTTPIAETIYSAPTGVGTLANPFTTNTEGELEFWLDVPAQVDLRYTKVAYGTETHTVEVLTHAAGGAHPDLAAHDTLGLATDAELTTHAADTTSVHGITDTTAVVLTGDARLSDQRVPTAGSVTDVKVAAGAAIAESKLTLASDAAVGTASRRTLGGGALQAAPGAGPFAPSSTGATAATRYVGGTAAVAPTTGTFAVGDFVISQNGSIWICTVAGSPGTWVLAQNGAYVGLTETVNTVATSGATQTIPDVTTATISRITLTANCTFTFPTAAAGKSFTLVLVQDGTGSRLATWPGTVKWPAATAPTLSTGINKIDYLSFVCTDGTNWAGFTSGLDLR